MLIIHGHSNCQEDTWQLYRKRNVCISSLLTKNSFLYSWCGCNKQLGILMQACVLQNCLAHVATWETGL